MIDALFGSKTRVKLLHLFLNNPGKAFYVREITRLIGEQINSVRRELSNMLEVGVLSCSTNDNKLFYEVNKEYEFYKPLSVMFSDREPANPKSMSKKQQKTQEINWQRLFSGLSEVRVVISAGVLVRGSASKVDLLVVGELAENKLNNIVSKIELAVGRDLTFSKMPYDEFYYRLSVRDRFVNDILSNRHEVIIDRDEIVKNYT